VRQKLWIVCMLFSFNFFSCTHGKIRAFVETNVTECGNMPEQAMDFASRTVTYEEMFPYLKAMLCFSRTYSPRSGSNPSALRWWTRKIDDAAIPLDAQRNALLISSHATLSEFIRTIACVDIVMQYRTHTALPQLFWGDPRTREKLSPFLEKHLRVHGIALIAAPTPSHHQNAIGASE